jgi:hypothetical protein
MRESDMKISFQLATFFMFWIWMNDFSQHKYSIFLKIIHEKDGKEASKWIVLRSKANIWFVNIGEKCISRLNWPSWTAKYICECPNTPMYIKSIEPSEFIRFISFRSCLISIAKNLFEKNTKFIDKFSKFFYFISNLSN